MAFLDVTKVFDCVSHVTLQRSLKGLGVPSPIVAYVANMYEHMTTVLKVGGRRSGPIQCNRGIWQGDPLSSFLFNSIMDEVLSYLSPAMGFTLADEVMVRCLAFADDLVLVTSTVDGLQEQTERIKYALGLGGLSLNPAKCAHTKDRYRRRSEAVDRKSNGISGTGWNKCKGTEYSRYLQISGNTSRSERPETNMR